MIAAGHSHSCGLRLDGSIACWGFSEDGVIGSGPGGDSSSPREISELSGVTAISAGEYHTCALRANGQVWCWGANRSGQLGNATRSDGESVPVRVSGISDAIAIDAGGNHGCAVVADGAAWCWGENRDGQLGDGTTVDQYSPLRVEGVRNAVSISAGLAHTCAVVAEGAVRCWGANTYGQLGDGTSDQRNRPVAVESIVGATAVSAGGQHTCAVLSDGTARCWGGNWYGQIGTGTLNEFDLRELPAPVLGITNAVAISAGGDHTCALLEGGDVWCWGYDKNGQLGFRDEPGLGEYNEGYPNPEAAPGVLGATAIAASFYAHNCALTVDGTALCWGGNSYGELGDGGEIGGSGIPQPITVVEFDIDQPRP